MPSFGSELFGRTDQDDLRASAINAENVVASNFELGQDGWIEDVNLVMAGGWDGTTYARLCLWDENRNLLWSSTQQSWGPNLALRTSGTPGIRMPRGTAFYAGFWRHPNYPAQWTANRTGQRFETQTHLTPLAPPDPFQPSAEYDPGLAVHGHWLRNHKPLKPAWRDGTPVGALPAGQLTFSASLPHPGEGTLAVLSGTLRYDEEGAPFLPREERTVAYASYNDDAATLGPDQVFLADKEEREAQHMLESALVEGATGDAQYDYTVRAQLVISRYVGGFAYPHRAGKWDMTFEVTEEEAQQGYFERQLFDLPTDAYGEYFYWLRHQDSWGVWSEWSDTLSFWWDDIPVAPTPLEPVGKIESYTNYSYRATYFSPNGQTADKYRIQIYNATGNVKLYDTFDVLTNTASGAEIVHSAAFHAPLVAGRQYRWRIRARQSGGGFTGGWSPWSRKALFYPNTPPYIPTRLSPSGGQALSPVVLFATVGDPDGDTIERVQARVIRAADQLPVYVDAPWQSARLYEAGQHVRPITPNGHRYVALTTGTSSNTQPAFPTAAGAEVQDGGVRWREDGLDDHFEMEIAGDGRSASLDVTSDVILNTEYQWQARAYDGTAWSGYSPYSAFLYALAPQVAMLTPSQTGLVNLVPQPSAEYDPAQLSTAFWEPVGGDQNNTLTRIVDGDAPSGEAAWRLVTNGNWDFYVFSNPVYLNAARPHFVTLSLKNYIGTPATHSYIACYDAANNRLADVHPQSVGLLEGDTPDPTWARYGGLVGGTASTVFPQKFPTGTAYIRFIVYPSASSTTNFEFPGEIRFDEGFVAEASVTTPETFALAAGFYGYFDGDTPTYGPLPDRAWEGEVGNSPSRGPAVLDTPSSFVEFSYFSETNAAKVDDRLVLELWTGSGWQDVYTSPYANNGARTTIGIPTSAVRNEGRYRVTVWAKDANALEGRSAATEFDVIYTGPSELPIQQVAADDRNGQIVVTFLPSELDPLEFAGIEVIVTDRSGQEITYFLRDPASTSFTYHFPEHGVAHDIRLRQVQWVGTEQIEGRWSRGRATVNYFPRFFIKNVANPGQMSVGFYAHEKPSYTPTRHIKQYLTWESKRPKQGVGKPRYDVGEITAFLYDHRDFEQSAETRFRMMEMLEDDMGLLCLLSHKPSKKRFVQITSINHSISESEDLVVRLGYTETHYSESALERGERL